MRTLTSGVLLAGLVALFAGCAGVYVFAGTYDLPDDGTAEQRAADFKDCEGQIPWTEWVWATVMPGYLSPAAELDACMVRRGYTHRVSDPSDHDR